MSKWKQDSDCPGRILNDHGQYVASCYDVAYAKQIIDMHNSHAALLAALKGMVDEEIDAAGVTLDMGPGGTREEEAALNLIDERHRAANEAIALAEPSP